MKPNYILLSFAALISLASSIQAQEFQPFSTTVMSGISGVGAQPASIADTRYKVDIMVTGGNAMAGSNYLGLKRAKLFQTSLWKEPGFGDENVYLHNNGRNKSANFSLGMFLPSFMVNVGEYSAFAFTARTRSVFNAGNISEDLATLIAKGFNYEPMMHRDMSNPGLNFQAHVWTEYGLSYARVVPVPFKKHFVKAGITLKYLQGVAAAYAYAPDFRYRLDGPDTLSVSDSNICYGMAGDFNQLSRIQYISDPGFAFSFGFVYEYRPDIGKYTYNLDGRKNLVRFDAEKYLVRVGVSFLDLGSIRYLKGFNSQDFAAVASNWALNDIEATDMNKFNQVLTEKFNLDPIKKESFRMRLPSVMNISIDYRLKENIYINFNPVLQLRKVSHENPAMAGYYSSYNLTARYDRKHFGAALPITVDATGRLKAGMAFRLGPVWIGSNSIITAFTGSRIYNTDAYFMIKIPVFRKATADDDHDEVSNELDMCPTISGKWELQGCPDWDNDGITDQNDECPSEAGPVLLNGCPDKDNDGIPDKNDDCPNESGSPQFNGCPDKDSDGIIDNDDECPEIAGLPKMRGCPDRDNDGIRDSDDDCPDTPGRPEYDGCPFGDYDKDGIPDDSDQCPTIAGPQKFYGCPDNDNDNVPDNVDLCPEIPGTRDNNGCPGIRLEEEEIINNAYSELQFESNKGIIKPESYPSLNQLATLLKSRKEWKILLSGHTDDAGLPDRDLELSKMRAQAVKDYLIGQGVDEFRIKAEWFGQTKPIADNKTTEGRKLNNRVEMKVIFNY